jgi:hypothetical protein
MITSTRCFNVRNLGSLVHYVNSVWNKSGAMAKAVVVGMLPPNVGSQPKSIRAGFVVGRLTWNTCTSLFFPESIISPMRHS